MKRLLPLALSLLFVACPAFASDPAATPSATETSATDDVKSQLVRYHWRLQHATDKKGRRIRALFVQPDKPLQLDFSDEWLSISNSCNYMSSDYALKGEFLIEGNGGSQTLVACVDPKLMALDDEIGKRLAGMPKLALLGGDTPALTLITAEGDKLVFSGKRIGQRMSLEVAAHSKLCSHPQIPGERCLQVREVKYDDSDGSFDAIGPFEDFRGGIDGFEREDGVRYVLDVERFAVEEPQTGHSRYRYVVEWIPQKDATGK
jgi:heat shock protein HslJ